MPKKPDEKCPKSTKKTIEGSKLTSNGQPIEEFERTKRFLTKLVSEGKPKKEKNPKRVNAPYNLAKKEECRKYREEVLESAKPKAKMGAPTLYNEEIADYIINRVASSKAGLHVLCKVDPKMPCQDTINEWRWKYPDFSARYLLAKQHQSHLMAEYCEELSDEKATYLDVTGQEKVDPGYIQHQRLRIDTRKWYASKVAPASYGDRKLVEDLKNDNETIKADLMAIKADLDEKNKKEY